MTPSTTKITPENLHMFSQVELLNAMPPRFIQFPQDLEYNFNLTKKIRNDVMEFVVGYYRNNTSSFFQSCNKDLKEALVTLIELCFEQVKCIEFHVTK